MTAHDRRARFEKLRQRGRRLSDEIERLREAHEFARAARAQTTLAVTWSALERLVGVRDVPVTAMFS